MANQVSQAFYVQDPVEQDWHYFMEAIPRDLFDMGAESSLDEAASSSQEFRVDALQNVVPVDNSDIQWSREDVDEILVDNPEDIAMHDDRAPTEAEVTENEHSGEAEMMEHVHKHSREAEMSDDEDGFSSEEEPADDVDEYSDWLVNHYTLKDYKQAPEVT
ncbi:unnamed protein product [Linum trigynum]|uniref:Uncharacterized protein n=2 Tax=Linum trigynum TaxID=586398 RepID=A0AAV2FRM2_9ROSI